ncbi:MarR family winged helix-turn-helix transcriptional regulator [Streptomyces sp. NPDC060223]|uniref:MarR family winged helix-turn-helix transcriptional regulator n=1 Tax=unclassified Streptomyces TaxID=2593676 RepID=UPI0036275D14
MTTATPPANGQVIALAHYASRAVLETVLARTGTTFHQSVTLNAVSSQGGTVEHDWLIGRLTGALKIEESAAREIVDEMTQLKLLEESAPGQASFTDSGRELFERIQPGIREVAGRLYAGISAEDLATAGRVLTLVTERANAELADV